MKITRIGDDRDLDIKAEKIVVQVNGKDFMLEEKGGKLRVATNGYDDIAIYPGVANVIYVK